MGVASKFWNHLVQFSIIHLRLVRQETTQLLFRLGLFLASSGLHCIFWGQIRQGLCACVCSGEFFKHRSEVPTCDPSTKDTRAGGLLGAPGQPGLYSEFKGSLGYILRHCHKDTENYQCKKQMADTEILEDARSICAVL